MQSNKRNSNPNLGYIGIYCAIELCRALRHNQAIKKWCACMKQLRWFLFYLLIIALSLELLLRLFAPILSGQVGDVARWISRGQPYAETWTPAWVQNRDHTYVLRPGLTDALQYGSPSVSFRLTTIELWEGGGIGFRTRPIDYFVDAVVVGDSFGLCFTEQADCWVDQLAAQMNIGIVNLSQPITGTTSHLRILQDFGAPLRPPLVIWQFFGNDFNDDYGLALNRGDIAPPAQTTLVHQTETPSPFVWLARHSALVGVLETLLRGSWSGLPDSERIFAKPYSVRYGDHVLYFGGLYEQQALDMSRPENQLGLEQSRAAFRTAQELVASWRGRLVVIIIPTREEVYAHLTEPILGADRIQTLASARLAMLDICAQQALSCYDPSPVFGERALKNESLYYADDMHLNAHGNAVLATALADWLME